MSFYNKLINKSIRYKHLISNFDNWYSFIPFKMFAKDGDSFTFKLRNSFSIKVEKKMLGPFRDCFFDEKYLNHLNAGALKDKEIVIVDIGANVGYFSLYALNKFPRARVFAFEPMPYCFHELQKYSHEFKNLSFNVYNYAVAKDDGIIDFYVQDEHEFSTDSTIVPSANKTRLQVKSIKWESLRNMLKISHIDILKLDCEGAEYAILYGLSKEEFERIDYITMEAHFVNAESDVLNMVQFLGEKNFEVFHEDFSKQPAGGQIWATRKS